MSPDEVIEKLHDIGIDITRRTLLNYEKWKLISEPQRGGGGNIGRWTNYNIVTVCEAYAAWSLLHGKYTINFDTKEFFSELPKGNPKTIYLARMCYLANRLEDLFDPKDASGMILIDPKYQDDVEFINNETREFRKTYDISSFDINEIVTAINLKNKAESCHDILLGAVVLFTGLYSNEISIANKKISEIGFY